MLQVIDLSDGAEEYTFPVTITETTGKDISADSIVVALGTATSAGGTWFAPDVLTRPTVSTAVVQVLIGGSSGRVPAAGNYFLWWKVTDTPEIVPRRSPLKITIK